MFTWINKQGVQSDHGFVVQFTGRFTCEYREGNDRLVIGVEDGFSYEKPCVIIRRSAFDYWKGKKTTPEQASVLLKNFKSAIEFQGLDLIVEKA
jgi:hypothetical protein